MQLEQDARTQRRIEFRARCEFLGLEALLPDM
jgi:hypothetical protein